MAPRQLRTGDLEVGSGDDILSTGGVGSCVVICLWDSVRRIGGMAHMLLPKDDSNGEDPFRSPGLSPDTAIHSLISRMESLGTLRANLSARVTGAGYMFGETLKKIPEEILSETIRVLNSESLPLISLDIGGSSGRKVAFTVSTGDIEIHVVETGRKRHL